MEQACEADNSAREKGQPAIHKLKMLPEVVALLNRNTVQHSIVDPDTNFLQSVKFFLEPLNDGSLPAYNIQRDLFTALTRLPIEKEALLSSGIGKVVLYYTKSQKPEIGIKRIAERLLGEWSRPILKRSDDYKKRKVITKEYDHQYVPRDSCKRFLANLPSEPRNSRFAPPVPSRRRFRPPSVAACHSGILKESAFLPSLSGATGLEWSLPMPVTPLLQRVRSMLVKASILLRDQLVRAVSRRLGR
jgi:hypothetical protein